MLSLVFSLCIAGQPCKVERVADFYTVMSAKMCETNKFSMSGAMADVPRNEGTTATFECKTMKQPLAVQWPVSEMVFEIGTGATLEKMQLAKFYGRAATPLCNQNRNHYEDVMLKSARLENTTGKLYCVDTKTAPLKTAAVK